MLTDHLPRTRLAHVPTPLHELPRLARALGGPRLFVKRDDQTGLAQTGEVLGAHHRPEVDHGGLAHHLHEGIAEALCERRIVEDRATTHVRSFSRRRPWRTSGF